MEVLLTGASGFLGTALARRLVDDGTYRVVASARRESDVSVKGLQSVIVGELGADSDWTAALRGVRVVIHTAARVHVMKDSASAPLAEYRKVNLEGTLNLARQAGEASVKRFIFVSTIKVNGESTTPGSFFTADEQPDPIDPYGISKWETEIALCQLAKEYDMELVIIRPPLVYGPGVRGR